jgi:hypothetical protein
MLGYEYRDFFMADAQHSPPPTLIEEVRRVLRLQHYSIHTERSYVEWIRRFARFHQMRSRADLFPAEPKIEASSPTSLYRAKLPPPLRIRP